MHNAPRVQGRRRWTSKAIRDVMDERKRQMEKLGWSPNHDDTHTERELARAGAAYAQHYVARAWVWRNPDHPTGTQLAYRALQPSIIEFFPDGWVMKPKSPREDLVRACALLVAEIERLDREVVLAHVRKHSFDPVQS